MAAQNMGAPENMAAFAAHLWSDWLLESRPGFSVLHFSIKRKQRRAVNIFPLDSDEGRTYFRLAWDDESKPPTSGPA
jgi:hypothetical protein